MSYVFCGIRALLRGAVSCYTVYDELMTAESIRPHRTDQNARLSHTLVPSQRTHLNVTRLETIRCNHEALAHLPFDTHLLGKEQREEAAAKEHDPEEKGRRDSSRIVSGEYEMVEQQRQGEIKD
jgi:hypothetical protein